MGYSIQKHLTKVNKGVKGNNKVEWIVVHFVGASGQAWDNANYFYNVYRGASAHYFVDPNNIVQVVEDDTPAWHVGDGSYSGKGKYNGYLGYGATNNNAVGIELAQDVTTGEDVWHWQFDPETVNRAEWLIKQLQVKYNVPDERVIRHYDVSGKLCPGNWQYNDWAKWREFKARLAGVDGVVATGNNKSDGKPTVTAKTHLVKAGDTLSNIAKKYGVTVSQLVAWNDLASPNLIFPETHLFIEQPKQTATVKSIDTLVKETLAGKYGNGEERKSKLGDKYDEVMAVINGGYVSKPKPAAKSTDTLVKETLAGVYGNGDARKKALGSRYDEVMTVINGTASTGKTITKKVVDDVIAGYYGNGVAREKNLRNAGYDPVKVQGEVNKRF